MEANELRIGNLVNYKIIDELDNRKEWYEVSEIDYDDLRILGIKDEMNQDYQPIHLTQEWLLKFGFEECKNYYIGGASMFFYDIDKSLENSEFYILFNEKKEIILSSMEEEININKKVNVYSVHQLQNLYFALTGQELILK